MRAKVFLLPLYFIKTPNFKGILTNNFFMDIRKASPQDYTTIYNIAVTTWDAAYITILSADQLEYMLDMMYSEAAYTEQVALKGHHFILAAIDGEVLGFASYEHNYRAETTKIHKLYVLPQAQGKGVGQALVAVIERAALSHTNDKLTLNVNRYNKAVHFYLKTGFEKAGEEDVDIGSGYLMEDFIMNKVLRY
jgi:GNAT superfamily N-acetyltransferase